MNKVTFPLAPGMQGRAVADLHAALHMLLDHAAILANDDTGRKNLSAKLDEERTAVRYGEVTAAAVRIFQKEQGIRGDGAVDGPTADAINRLTGRLDGDGEEPPPYTVDGTISYHDGYPASAMRVAAFDRDLRSEQFLNEAQTDRDGYYRISYSAKDFAQAEKGGADLVVKVFGDNETLLAASPVLFNARPAARIDVSIAQEALEPPSLFERIEQALTPLLRSVPVAGLEQDGAHDDLVFLAGETGIEIDTLARFAMAHRFERDPLPATFWFVLLGSTLFSYNQQQTMGEQQGRLAQMLPSLDALAVRKQLVRGFNAKDIAEKLSGNTEIWIEAFVRVMARESLSENSPHPLVRHALDDAGVKEPVKQLAFSRLYNEHGGVTPDMLAALDQLPDFTKEEVADLRTSFALSELTQGDFSTVSLLKRQLKVREPAAIPTLARRSPAEWISLVERAHESGELTLPYQVSDEARQLGMPEAHTYGAMLERQFREAYPTAAFSGSLQRALDQGGAPGLSHAKDLSAFLEMHQDFELLTTPIDAFLDQRPNTSPPAFRTELKTVQRMFKLTSSFEATATLMEGGYHSAQQIYRQGKSEFVSNVAGRAGWTIDSASATWNRAADTHAATLTILMDLKALEPEGLPLVLKNKNVDLATFPNWNNLFQGGDLCDCAHCRSVLSPAAYFADLLMFLRERKSVNPAKTVKDILFARRPDLGYLELNCANALTPLPYIDVVCEVLEDVVANGENDLALPGFAAIPAVNPEAAVGAAFAAANVSLGASFTLSQVDSADPNRWVVHGEDITYLLKKKGALPDFFAQVLPNTKTGAAELRAYPQYVNPKAYDKLRTARYPLGLPFDLFAGEVRADFQKTNLQRWDLMRTLHGPVAPNNPSDGEIAADYFGISADSSAAFDEKRLILVADASVAGQQALWGETGATWLAKVGNVKNFLLKTGLEYVDLQALLDLTFINPAGDIVIHHLDASCDTDQKVIQVLTAAKLDVIHRFLRLSRKLDGWASWELDLVIRHAAIGLGALDEALLIRLYYLGQLKKRLGAKVTVEQLCTLFGNINTATRFTEQHEKRDDALYQMLFQNRKLTHPLDPAFALDPGTGDLPAGATISAHHPVLLAALGVRENDLIVFKTLTRASNGLPYINDDLNLANLSFLWRHAWLSRQLKLKADEWKTLLKLFNQDIPRFADPQAVWTFLEQADRFKASGFTVDQLDWILAANRLAKAAVKESDAARFLMALRTDIKAIRAQFDPAAYPFLGAPVTDVEALTALLNTILPQLHRDEAGALFFIATLRDEVRQQQDTVGMPAGFVFPASITAAPNHIPIRYEDPVLRFEGVMSAAQSATLLGDPALAAVTGLASYTQAIEAFFAAPRLALKFFDPVFSAPLAGLPAAVDFAALADPALRLKVTFDAEQKLLSFTGIMTAAEKSALDALSADVPYRNAVNSLATQPAAIAAPDPRIWLQDADLLFPLRDLVTSANDNLAANLATALNKVLPYLSRTLVEGAVVREAAAQLNLSEALTRHLLADYPTALLAQLSGPFAATSGVVDYATLKATFDGWYWAVRAASLLTKWKITLEEQKQLLTLTAGAQLLDLASLPLDDTGPQASITRLLRSGALIKLRDSLPETGITLLEVLRKLATGAYAAPADFALDVELLNEAWLATDVQALVVALDIVWPVGYLLAESWERLRRAFYFLDSLNATTATALPFAAAAMGQSHARTVTELLRAKFGPETWLTLSADIQDALRERKRDALTAWLLTQPKPADAPTGKWENTNDLYAYYLLDVEMASCQLTSRMVQGSGSVQLFVQRCFMGLEPAVKIDDGGVNGDSAWRWWSWMRKYRVWEANRKVFLWPENWIAPELKKDRSSFFKDLENELQQNEVTQDSVETAFGNYLEKLNSVAQLEIAGFYQEDDGDDTIVHTFGRNTGTEPHLYYYRRYDYRQWTPWEKIDLDIQGDYLIPMVIDRRLFLAWPVFTEVQDEDANSAAVPIPGASDKTAPIKKTRKKLQMQMAVSDYRGGKWTPRRISKDFAVSGSYEQDLVRSHYRFFPIDRSEIDGRFGVKYEGYSADSKGNSQAGLFGAFELSGCKGVPEQSDIPGYFKHAMRPEQEAVGYVTTFHKWVELGPWPARLDAPENDFTLENSFASGGLHLTPVLNQTPWIFRMTPAWHLSWIDRLFADGLAGIGQGDSDSFYVPVGSWLPYFYNDKKRTFFVLPVLAGIGERGLAYTGAGVRYYYPDVKIAFRTMRDAFAGFVQTWVDGFDLAGLSPAARQQVEALLAAQFPEEPPPPMDDAQVKALMFRWVMRFFNLFLAARALVLFQYRKFHFKNYYHPYVCSFAKLLHNPLKGIPALMRRETQLQDSGFSFHNQYRPTGAVLAQGTEQFYPREMVDFTPDGAYSPYNWELFFHAPLLIANSLSANQRFEEARAWYHYIFNPLGLESSTPGGSAMSKYWITKPFFETTDPQYVQQRIENIMRMLAGDTGVPGYSAQLKKDLEDQVRDWRTNPFEPHRIANYRTVAYQKTVVMKYLDNLIAWGDNLFRQDSMESINEATQLYVLAAEILGPRPKKVPPQATPPVESYNELEKQFDVFSNALVEVENLVPVSPGSGSSDTDPAPLPMLYFCIPHNDQMLAYWDTVADRLYKIRHCMNIEGVVRQLALFEPPIDPGALVKAVAAGIDIGAALADLNAPLPHYRFALMLQKANEVCNDVKALGGALLAALEKKDAEALALLRQGQELSVLEAVRSVRERQIDEARDNLAALVSSREMGQIKKRYYESREFMNAAEIVAMTLNTVSTVLDIPVSIGYIAAGVLKLIPNFLLGASGFGGSPHVTGQTGGSAFGDSAKFAAEGLAHIARNLDKMASLSSTVGTYIRRKDDWNFQSDLAVKEIEQVGKSIAAAEVRISIAQKELDNQQLQIDNAKAMDAFMRTKYTGQELYQWQVTQISGVYFQSYRLAFDLAKRAERSFRFELGLQDSSHIKFGYWDSLKKGLLSGEKLQYDLRRMENAYLEQNRREFELTKHVSLALTDPLALITLRETGRCFFSIREEHIDLDYPGHYFRRIKSASLTLPLVAGAYTTVPCTLRLLRSSIRINTANGDNGYPRNTDDAGLPVDDMRFVESNVPVKSIATSSAQNDSGLFELNYRDERYLPFEGAGAVSDWAIELFSDLPSNNPDPMHPDFGEPLRQFDYETIADVVLHVRYTAREDAGPFKNGAISHLREFFDGAAAPIPSLRMFNLRQEFPGQWQRFLMPANPASGNVFELPLARALFPLRDQGKALKVTGLWLLARCTDDGSYAVALTANVPAPNPAVLEALALGVENQYRGMHATLKEVDIAVAPLADPPLAWQFKMTRPGGGNLQPDPATGGFEVSDMLLVIGYKWD